MSMKFPRGRDGVVRHNIMGKRSYNTTTKNEATKTAEPSDGSRESEDGMQLSDLPFDLTEANVGMLGLAIGKSIEKGMNLVCYSSEAMKNPGVSLTQMPNLAKLFQRACLQQGLLGYLDWKNEITPSDQNTIIRNNIIIATCGKIVENDGLTEQSKGLAHEVDETKLAFLRKASREEFEQIKSKAFASLYPSVMKTAAMK